MKQNKTINKDQKKVWHADRKMEKEKLEAKMKWVSGRTEFWDVGLDPNNCPKTKTKII